MKLTIKSEFIDVTDPNQLNFLKIFSLFHFSKVFKVIYSRHLNQEITLPTSESIMILYVNMAYLAECFLRLQVLVDGGMFSRKESWNKTQKDSWDFLFSNDGQDIKERLIKIRNKSVFHVDPEMILNFSKKYNETETLKQIDEENNYGFSPFIMDSVANWLDDLDMMENKNVENYSMVHHCLDQVITAIMNDIYEDKIKVISQFRMSGTSDNNVFTHRGSSPLGPPDDMKRIRN